MTTETDNAVVENDNVDSGSLLGDTAIDTNEAVTTDEVVTEGQEQEGSSIPEKFLNEDGTPDYDRLSKSYTELEKKFGSKVSAESANDYDYQFENEDIFDSEADLGDIKEQMLELGVSKEQFSGVMGMWENAVVDIVNELQGTPERATEALKEEWGDAMDSNLQNARAAWDAFAAEGMNIDAVGNNPTMIALLAYIGAQMGEDVKPPAGGNAGTGMTETEMNDIMARDDYWTNQELQAKVAGYFASKR